MTYTFDYLVYIGRFQPFHLAHMQTINIALQQGRELIIALGSAQAERSIKNPFSASERKAMILACYPEDLQQRLHFVDIEDVYNDVKWVNLLKKRVQDCIGALSVQPCHSMLKVGLIGHFKDDSSYYLSLFPDWQLVELDSLRGAISATPLRRAYFQGKIIEQEFPAATVSFLKQFKHSRYYQALQKKFQQQDYSILLEHEL
ncbi:nicotinate-nicotinamide nucleotide adenylyltransferase [Acinetobacter larvae]|uniref:Nicotinamide-nucleotide adenylyltransferase n=1 Tax=Acinetobacter larvae TaxID=1789224 RepID=A0A1B2LY28_9GAMM|nr:nicotinate-nicotinamide nucleotide adenylyltransferase [Acinetobacter larvae]AOA57673.1 nicotinamide-nucleotide adenylyltransferase [Acinetobacter larvae]